MAAPGYQLGRGCQPGGASSKPAKSKAGATVQPTRVQSPLLCGLHRPVLLLPPRMCEDSYRSDLPAIFAHELTHVRFHDLLWNAGLHLVSIVLWFHPLAWRRRES